MSSSRKKIGRETETVSLRDKLVEAGLSAHIADALQEMPQRRVQLDPRRPFREPGAALD